jgi:hypothetical protein
MDGVVEEYIPYEQTTYTLCKIHFILPFTLLFVSKQFDMLVLVHEMRNNAYVKQLKRDTQYMPYHSFTKKVISSNDNNNNIH